MIVLPVLLRASFSPFKFLIFLTYTRYMFDDDRDDADPPGATSRQDDLTADVLWWQARFQLGWPTMVAGQNSLYVVEGLSNELLQPIYAQQIQKFWLTSALGVLPPERLYYEPIVFSLSVLSCCCHIDLVRIYQTKTTALRCLSHGSDG